ncbi:MAG TPA: pyridoxamine 5'-phosphate oxidase family protein [Dehalococcoidia bacterium]|nr:pyridoxamine 5'-phosphate oxidase family protein [Dehalococcoidia bacterium]
MPQLSPSEQEEFLGTPGVLMRIATVDAKGHPHVTPIWYLHEEGRIWFTPRQESAWLGHVRTYPRVALTIDEEAGPYRKVIVEGDAKIVCDLGEDDTWRDRYRRIALRYVDVRGADVYIRNTIDQPRALLSVALASASVRTWRMPREGEPRTGIWHRRYYVGGSKYAEEADGR